MIGKILILFRIAAKLSKKNLASNLIASPKSSSISLAALISSYSSKWLFLFSNGIYNRNYKTNNTNSSLRNDFAYTDITSIDDLNNYDLNETETTLKAAKIWERGSYNYSFGFFGIIYGDNILTIRNHADIQNTNYIRSDTVYQHSQYINSSNSSLSKKSNRYVAGIEFSVNNSDWDYIGSVSYQNLNSTQELSYNYTNSYLRNSLNYNHPGEDNYESTTTNNLTGILNKKINTFSLNNYFQRKIDWITNDDNVFVTLNSFYANSDADFNGFTKVTNRLTSTNSSINTDSITNSQKSNLNGKSWGINISAGYSLTQQLSDIFILAGFKLSGENNHIKDLTASLSPSTASSNKVDGENKSASIKFPLYINYFISDWVSVYGGLNYSYYYSSY